MKPLDHDDGFGGASEHVTFVHARQGNHLGHALDSGAAAVPSAALLFSGHYHQSGYDLVISRPLETVTIHDYFRSDIKANLVAPDGSELSADVVLSLTEGRPGIQYAGDQPAPATAIGRVESASGEATVIRNGQTVTLHAGDLVIKGDAVETGEHGALAITFIDGTAFTLAENARMVLNDMVYQANGTHNSSLLSLVQGSITFVAGQVAHTGEMKVDTPVATMGIRGTAVHVNISAHNGPTRFSVMREPNGRVGSYVLYSHKDGSILATVSQVGNFVELQLNNGDVIINTFAKTPLDFQQEQDFTHQVFNAFQAGQQDSLLKALMQIPQQNGGGSHGSSGPPQTGPSAGQTNDQTPANNPPATPPAPTPPQPPAPTPPTQQNNDQTPPPTTNQNDTQLTPPTAPAETVLIAKNAGFDSALPITGESVVGIEAANAQAVTPVSSGGVTVTGLYGDLTISADGSFHYVANHAAVLDVGTLGVDTFNYTVTNSSGQTATSTLTFDVVGASNNPVIAGPIAAGTVSEKSAVQTIDLLNGATSPNPNEAVTVATDGQGHPLVQITAASGPVAANAITFNVDANGHLTLDPSQFGSLGPTQSETLTFAYTVVDASGGATAQTATITIDAAPTVTYAAQGGEVGVTGTSSIILVSNESETLFSGGSNTFTMPGTEVPTVTSVTGDLVNLDAAALLADGWTLSTNGNYIKAGLYGTATLFSNGVPYGTASAQNTRGNSDNVDDGGDSGTTVFTFNDAPVNGQISYQLTSTPPVGVTTDTFTVPFIDSLGAVVNGIATFTDGYLTPVFSAPATEAIGIGKTAAILGVSLSEPGSVSGEKFTVEVADAHGVLSVGTSSAEVSYFSNAEFSGLTISGTLDQVNAALANLTDTDNSLDSDMIVISAADQYASTTQQSIAITVNDVPSITAPGAQTIGINHAATISGINLSESGNTDGETFTATLTDAHGNLSVSGDGGTVAGQGTTSLTISGSLDQVNAYLATLQDTDAAPGSDTITLNASDAFGNSAGQQTIAVTANSAPIIAVPGAQTVGVNHAAAISGISVSESGNTSGETFTATLTDSSGLLSVTGSGAAVTGNDTTSLTISGSLDQVNAYLATLTDTINSLPSFTGFIGLTPVHNQLIGRYIHRESFPEDARGSPFILIDVTDSYGNSAVQQSIAVTANGAPSISVPGSQTLGINQAGAIPGITLSESGNSDGETFTATINDTHGHLFVSGSGGSAGGSGTTSLTISGTLDQANAYLATLNDIDPTAGADTITLNAIDSFGNSAVQETIAVTANGQPALVVPVNETIGLNQAAAISGISLSESGNTDGETFTVAISDLHGSLSVSGSGGTVSGSGTASLTITGSLSQVNAYLASLSDTDATAGSDTITLNASDSFGNNAIQKTIPVTTNGVPSIIVPGTQALTTGVAAGIAGVSVSESGNTTGSETFSATLTDTYGDLTVTGNGGTVTGSGTTSLSISGVTLAQLNAYLGTLSDTDSTSGSDTITLNVSDSFGNNAAQQTIGVTASHAGWTGDTLGEIYYFPTAQTVYQGQQNFIVPASGISGSNGDFYLSVGASTITASQFSFDGYWVPSSFNGFVVFDTNNDPQISSVTIDSITNMSGFTTADISFTSNSVTVNWQSLSFNTDTVVQLDLTFDPPLDPSKMSIGQTLDGSVSPAGNTSALHVADGTELALIGTINNTNVIDVDGASAATAIGMEGNVTLEGGGQVILSESNENYVIGSGVLTNADNEIIGGGDIGNGTLTIHNAGVIEAEGSYALIVDTGANSIVNTGLLEANNGTLIVDSPVTGGGHALVNGGTIEFAAASDNSVSFESGSAGTLALDQSQKFTGTVSGFDAQDKIDLGDIGFSSDSTFSYIPNGSGTGGTLSMSDGTHVAAIALLGAYTAASFATASDGHGGTVLTTTVVSTSSAAAAVQDDSDAPFVFAPATGPAVLNGSQSANISQTITGTPYADTITAGAGNDTLTGMGGGDTFVFKTNMGNDQITDLHTSNANGQHDTIDLSTFHFANYQALAAATTANANGDAVIELGTHTLTLDHVQKADLQSSLFHL